MTTDRVGKDVMTAVLVDLDSTLYDTRQRHPFSPHKDKTQTWADYAARCVDDVAVPGVVRLIHLLAPFHKVLIVSARAEASRALTESCLVRDDVPFDAIFLYDGDPAGKVDPVEHKLSVLEHVRAVGYNPVLLVDDWPEVVEAFTENGVPGLCVNPMYRDDPNVHHYNEAERGTAYEPGTEQGSSAPSESESAA